MDSEPNKVSEQSSNAPRTADGQPIEVTVEFKRVFSTTAKVMLSVFLILLGIGLVWAILESIPSRRSGSSEPEEVRYAHTYLDNKESYNKTADDAFTKMPLSQWKSVISTDIFGHCIREGMTTREVEKAVGKPTAIKSVPPPDAADTGAVWEYTTKQVVNKPCSRYEGEKCADPVEYETKTATLYFSPNGHLTFPYLNGALHIDAGEGYSTCY